MMDDEHSRRTRGGIGICWCSLGVLVVIFTLLPVSMGAAE